MVKKKGKAQQGRAKQKQKAQKGNNAEHTPSFKAPRHVRRNLDYDDDDEDDETYRTFRGFAQSKPAPEFGPRSASVRLRHQSIAFVSAGVNPSSIDRPPPILEEATLRNPNGGRGLQTDLDTDSDDDDIDEEDIDDSAIQINITTDNDMHLSEDGIAKMRISGSPEDTAVGLDERVATVSETRGAGDAVTSDAPAFIVDIMGDPALNDTSNPVKTPSAQRTSSPTPSDCSEEVILFHGRNRASYKPRTIEDPVDRAAPATYTPHVTDDLLRALETEENTQTPDKRQPASLKHASAEPHLPERLPPAPTELLVQGKGKAAADKAPLLDQIRAAGKNTTRRDKLRSENIQKPRPDRDAEETIATLQADWKDVVRAKQYTKNDEGKSKPSKRRGKRGRKKGNRELINAVFSDDDGSAEEAAYDDYMQNLAMQLEAEGDFETDTPLDLTGSAHLALGGPSMVVDGKAYDDNELLSKQLEDAGIDETNLEEAWESETDSELNPDSDEISVNESDLEDELEYTEQQQWEDEADLRQRRTDKMTDEHLARLFAKQQELGYHGDDLIIDDGADMTSDGVGDVAAARAGIIALGKLGVHGRNTGSSTNRRSRRNEDVSFPDASALADVLDQYGANGFDIMDYDRPSLRATKKGRKGKPPPEIEMLSDEELKEDLNRTWENDRDKKRQKKLEREELRVQGLLGPGGKRDHADLGAKYPQGMTLKQVYTEMREFLLDDGLHERAFPPMDKKDRKALHEISLVLQLTCKSQGAGKNRFPVLYKKKQTVAVSEDLWRRLMEASSRGFFTNRGKPKGFARAILDESRRSGRAGRGGGFDKSAVTLRNGEVVGAGAKEIGSENFGHRMMEKMGWTKGQALGKDGGGLLVPVEQRMRVGTAGLG